MVRRMGETPGGGRMRTTRWSIVLAARSRDEAEARAALDTLCKTYWYPVYGWFRRQRLDDAQARDLTQDLFLGLIARRDLEKVKQERGRFRSYLLACANHVLLNERDRATAQKRGGGEEPLSLDDPDAHVRFQAELSHGLSPDRLYDRRFAQALLETALRKLRDEYVEKDKGAWFDAVKGFLTGDGADGTYAELAPRLETNANALKTAVSRLNTRYKELVLAEVSETVEHAHDAEDELRSLLDAWDDTRRP